MMRTKRLALLSLFGSLAAVVPGACADSIAPSPPMPWDRISGTMALIVENRLLLIDGNSRTVSTLLTGNDQRIDNVLCGFTSASSLAWTNDGNGITFSACLNSGVASASDLLPFLPEFALKTISITDGRISDNYRVPLTVLKDPVWSRDGRLAYTSDGPLYTGMPNGAVCSFYIGVTPLSNAKCVTRGAWAADSRSIFVMAGSADSATFPFGLYRLGLSDNSRALVVLRGAGSILDPTTSPDGANIAFIYTRNTATFPDTAIFESTLRVVNADGSGTRILATGHFAYQPSWSSDGRQLAFIRDAKVFIVNADGSAEVQVPTTGQPYAIAWKP